MRRGRTAIYELEIAFDQIPEPGTRHCPPWLVDRIFRQLLVDVTGNTHRAEFCIDKLYSPDSSHRPPGPARAARLRNAAARADEPGAATAGARADRLVLEAAVHAASRSAGERGCTTGSCCRTSSSRISATCWRICAAPAIAFEPEWFAPHFEFRFPVYRHASSRRRSSWNCARRSSPGTCWAKSRRAGGTARYVDSSVERLQVERDGADRRTLRGHLQRPARAAATHRHARRVRVPASAIAPGSRRRACIRRFRSTRRWCSTSWTPGADGRSAAAPITWRIPAAATTTTFPVNANEAEAGAGRGSSRSATRRGRCRSPPRGRESGVPADARLAQARRRARAEAGVVGVVVGRGACLPDEKMSN